MVAERGRGVRPLRAVGRFASSGYGRVAAVASIVGVVIVGGTAIASADAVDDGFTSVQTALTGYLGDAVALVLAIVVLAVGIRMLVRWAKRAAAT